MKKKNRNAIVFEPIVGPWSQEKQESYNDFEKEFFRSFQEKDLGQHFTVIRKGFQQTEPDEFDFYDSHVFVFQDVSQVELLKILFEKVAGIENFISPCVPQGVFYSMYIYEYRCKTRQNFLVYFQSNLGYAHLKLIFPNCYETLFFEKYRTARCRV